MRKSLALLKLGLIGLIFITSVFTQAQKKPGYLPASIDDNEEIPVVKTELPVPEKGKDYVVQYFKGITDGVESRIAVKNLGYIIRPAMVQVISEDGRELAIELVKKNWDDVVRSGKTKQGKYQNSFKTALEFGIKISAKEMGIPFIVAVSAGVELFPASNLFVDAGTMKSGVAIDGSPLTDETGSAESSNTLLYIIIAIALIGIFALLAVLVFRKKGKGAATILLLVMVLPLYAGIVPSGVELLGGLGENLAKGLGQHYGKGGFGNDSPLSEDDRDFEPELDPRGQPSLPSSCPRIARMGSSGGTVSSGSITGGFDGAKNPTNADGSTNMTLDTGGMAGGISGGESGEDVGQEEGKDRDFAKERQKIQDNFRRYRELALERRDLRKSEAQENFNQASREASKQLDKALREANENASLIAQATANHANTFARLTVELATANARFDADYSVDLADLSVGIANDLEALAQEEASANQDQQNSGIGEKDPNRQPKKDPEREQGKGDDAGDIGKGVDPTNEEESGGSNAGPRESNEDREKRAGCKCLEEAYADLQEQRYKLTKLLMIGQHTKKVTDFGISFGDDFSGVHAVSGLAWQKQRAKVLKSIEKFDTTYNNKYKELIDKLYKALIQIDECESKLGYENWYSNAGFIYYEFMREKYKR